MSRGRHLAIRQGPALGHGRRSRIASLGVFAVLFQALLFGWHHHPANFSSHGPLALAAPAADQPLAPITADDDCDICAALHHHSAAPLAFFGLVPPPPGRHNHLLLARVFIELKAPRYFQGRAPPRA
ncbi:MAG: hypothetical protein JO001_13510 [Alphaproteobacteria bacterium]|nr:hypothetical protein [Alphaproteobacteria bacterium]